MAHRLTNFHLPSFSPVEKLKFVSNVWLCWEIVENSNICTRKYNYKLTTVLSVYTFTAQWSTLEENNWGKER